VIFVVRIGSFSSIGVSTTRRPLAVSSAIVLNAPAGTASAGQAISRSDIEPSSAPKRSGFEAMTMVWVVIGFFCDSRLLARISAWLVSQACARKTAITPSRTANPIITMVLERTRLIPFGRQVFFRRLVVAHIASRGVLNW
jgi:hypothetical protein